MTDEINIRGNPVGSTVGGGKVDACNIAGRGIHEHHHYPAAEVTFPLHHLPPANPNFTGRQEFLTAIQAAFQNPQSEIILTQAIAGLGGVGKTQLALAYAHAHRDAYDLIWWLDGSDPALLDTNLRQLGLTLGLAVQTADATAARQMVLAWLTSAGKHTLLVYDNMDSVTPRDLRLYLPGGGHLLITSRQPHWPGALEQAAAYMARRRKSAADYLRLYRERRRELWARAKPPDDYHATSLNNLGGLLQAMGDYEAARPYYERDLAILEVKLGPEHPNTQIARRNLEALSSPGKQTPS